MSINLKEIDGLPVVDAKTGITLTITPTDVSKAGTAAQKHPEGCAVARACVRELNAFEARVHLSRVYVRANKGNWVRYITPTNLAHEIIAYDRGGRFEPGEFHLKAPSPSNKLGVRRNPGPKKTKGKKRRPPHVTQNVRTGPA